MKPSSTFMLIITSLGAVGAWLLTLTSWAAATTPSALGGLFVGLASVIGAAFGVRNSNPN